MLSQIPGIEHGFQSATEAPPEGLCACHQVHGKNVVEAVAGNKATLLQTDADGLISEGAFKVGIQTADCLPVLFADRSARWVAAVHAGWRGLENGILVHTVAQLKERGVAPRDLVAAIGPGIGLCCYEVSTTLVVSFEKRWGFLWKGVAPPWVPEKENKSHMRPEAATPGRGATTRESNLWIDLDRIAKLQLLSAGLDPAAIEDVGGCTYCGDTAFASFRRSTHERHDRCGRQWSWIGKRQEGPK